MTLFDLTPYYRQPPNPHLIKEMLVTDQPMNRLEFMGPEALSTAELLACILQTKDALDLSQRILTQVRSLAALTNATPSELQQIQGIERGTVNRIHAALELGRRCMTEPNSDMIRIANSADAANLFMPRMMHLEQEHLAIMMLNTRNEMICGIKTIYKGSVNTSVVRVAEIYRPAIRHNAVTIIVAHNHPSGDPSPSPEDIRVTQNIVKMGKELDITCLDHLIIGHQRYVSLRERGMGFE